MIGAWMRVLIVDVVASFGGFARLNRFISGIAVRPRRGSKTAAELRDRFQQAATFYPREIFCLRRSAALAWFLRSHGYRAELIIGTCVTPFLAHAWCELDGRIINDDEERIRGTYVVLERC